MKNVPLRDWASASYSALDGRAAKSSEGPRERYGADGEVWSVNAQLPVGQAAKGTPSLKELDRMRTQNVTPVRKRPIG